jgi:hypothetical protein
MTAFCFCQYHNIWLVLVDKVTQVREEGAEAPHIQGERAQASVVCRGGIWGAGESFSAGGAPSRRRLLFGSA